MNANPQSLEALFNPQLRYIVPMFQRKYVWNETPQWTTLWEDISEKALLQIKGTRTNPHYLGALIIEGVRPTSPREVKRFLVIDGQQRLTTLQLLFCAFRDIARKNCWRTLDRTLHRYLENADVDVMENADEEQFKLWPTTLNRKVFTGILSATSDVEVSKRFPIRRLPRKRKPEPRNNLVEAYFFFYNRITSWLVENSNSTAKTLEEVAFCLLQSLQQDFCVVEISLSPGDDSQEIFYSLNSQGQPLSQSDLLRSLVFMRAEREKVDRDELFEKYWIRFETPFWSGEVYRTGRRYSRLDLCLRYFLMTKTGQLIDARRVNEEYRAWTSSEKPPYTSVRDELTDLARYAERYEFYDGHSSSSLPCTDARRILTDFEVSTCMPLILFLELEAKLEKLDYERSFASIESFLARRVITGDETREYNKLFVDVVRTIRDSQGAAVFLELQRKLLAGGGTTRRWPTDEEVMTDVITRPAFDRIRPAALRLILERLELNLRNKKSESVEVFSGLQIEHVMPQSWSANWPLNGKTIPKELVSFPYLAEEEFSDTVEAVKRRNDAVQTIGNLTLVNRFLNPAAGNRAFRSKIEEYRNSVLRLNRYFSDHEAWDEDAIIRRGRLLGRAICEIWPRPITPA